ncbi:hypothetical protein EX30DRAFT_383295 [Ascodesmis nigricans]|uniref:Uncharacterized protein n=1 Tax=Ascodesmis nigricans TaxID=341454 RepID=A0A4S2MNS7_9PEZI|nr:hypothetical protein EX30DRAFT_383295 [Ascodesmis nigricans]
MDYSPRLMRMTSIQDRSPRSASKPAKERLLSNVSNVRKVNQDCSEEENENESQREKREERKLKKTHGQKEKNFQYVGRREEEKERSSATVGPPGRNTPHSGCHGDAENTVTATSQRCNRPLCWDKNKAAGIVGLDSGEGQNEGEKCIESGR